MVGIIVGPSVLGWVEVDGTIEVMATIGPGFLLFLGALAGSATMVPLFLAALLAVRGLPAAIYGLDRRETLVAGLLQATSLPFLVATTAIGQELGLIGAGESAALVGAGLLSVLLFPAAGLTLLESTGPAHARAGRFGTT